MNRQPACEETARAVVIAAGVAGFLLLMAAPGWVPWVIDRFGLAPCQPRRLHLRPETSAVCPVNAELVVGPDWYACVCVKP